MSSIDCICVLTARGITEILNSGGTAGRAVQAPDRNIKPDPPLKKFSFPDTTHSGVVH